MPLLQLGLVTVFCGVVFTVAVCLTAWVIMWIIDTVEDRINIKKLK